MESQSELTIAKVAAINKHISAYKEKMNNRMARLLWENKELQPSYTVLAPRSLQSTQQSSDIFQRLENPLVIGSILAGVVGVVAIAIIILGVWVRSKLLRRQRRNSPSLSSPGTPRQNEHVDIDPSIILSSISMSTLDMDEIEEETQMESLQLDDTTFYSANDVSIPIPGEGTLTGSFNSDGELVPSYEGCIVDEGLLCDITLSPM